VGDLVRRQPALRAIARRARRALRR
jgi:hypothetical protein